MKLFKKLLALTLVLCMVFCLSSAVFADVTSSSTETPKTVTIKKDYVIANANTTAPAETFYLKQTDKSVSQSELDGGTNGENIPNLITLDNVPTGVGADGDIIVGKAVYATAVTKTTDGDKERATITVTLPTYTNVGIYTYKLSEINNGTAGVDYFDDNDILVVVSVYWDENSQKCVVGSVHTEKANEDGSYDTSKEDEDGNKTSKSDVFENKYEAGSLTVSKTVNGNLGDKDKEFSFTVTFIEPEGKNVNSTITTNYNDTDPNASSFDVKFDDDGKYSFTFKLSNGESAKFSNIPYGVKYTVKENLTGTEYTTTCKTDNTDTTLTNRATAEVAINSASTTVAFTNTRTGEIDMGVSLDSLPYILALAVAFGGAVVMITRKRHVED